MPIATFAGQHGWRYDGFYIYAPHPAYGGPEAFARLVDAAHEAGLAVILDVVYNHLGTGSNALTAFGPCIDTDKETVWGGAIDYSEPALREWAIQNAATWVRDHRLGGARLDAVHAIFDESCPHIMADPDTLLYHRELMPLRRELARAPSEVDTDAENLVPRFRCGEVEMVANFPDTEHDGVPPRIGVVRW
jgi:maltooligosyltrehalose trehalohydrolase